MSRPVWTHRAVLYGIEQRDVHLARKLPGTLWVVTACAVAASLPVREDWISDDTSEPATCRDCLAVQASLQDGRIRELRH